MDKHLLNKHLSIAQMHIEQNLYSGFTIQK